MLLTARTKELIENLKVIEHRGYVIQEADVWYLHNCRISYCHKDYDGPGDRRCGLVASLEEAIEAIDEAEGFPIEAGDEVAYLPLHSGGDITHPDVERGFVSSVNDAGTVFVRFQGCTANSQGCDPDMLRKIYPWTKL